ncbi:MAG: ATP-binding protein [Polyangiaceae bacterium]|nr:ATP-binding protein [Polyangiaceae bacterium]
MLVAPQGLGKTMIAQNIAHQAILAGTRRALPVGRAALARPRRTRVGARPRSPSSLLREIGLLIIDGIGFLAFDRNADLLFQVVSRRYEKKSLVLTTNLAFRDWPTIFPNATCATALVDRVVHHADVIHIEGKSWRSSRGRSSPPGPPSQEEEVRGAHRDLNLPTHLHAARRDLRCPGCSHSALSDARQQNRRDPPAGRGRPRTKHRGDARKPGVARGKSERRVRATTSGNRLEGPDRAKAAPCSGPDRGLR